MVSITKCARKMHAQGPAVWCVQYSAASFIETINSSSLTMDSDEFVARMIAAGVPDIEAASTQPLSPKLKVDPTPASPKAGAPLIPAASEDNMGLTPQPSQPSLASKKSCTSAPCDGSDVQLVWHLILSTLVCLTT